MHLHHIQHVAHEGLGTIADWAAERGHTIETSRMFAGDALPEVGSYDLLVIMGGPMNIYEDERYPWLAAERRFVHRAVAERAPVLGICLGSQFLADALGASVSAGRHKEIGWFPIERCGGQGNPFRGFWPERMTVFHWHGDTFELPPGAHPLAASEACPNQGFVQGDRLVGLQCHLEMRPADVQALVEHGGAELSEPGPYIQSPEALVDDRAPYAETRAVMHQVLDLWAEAALAP